MTPARGPQTQVFSSINSNRNSDNHGHSDSNSNSHSNRNQASVWPFVWRGCVAIHTTIHHIFFNAVGVANMIANMLYNQLWYNIYIRILYSPTSSCPGCMGGTIILQTRQHRGYSGCGILRICVYILAIRIIDYCVFVCKSLPFGL